MGYHNWNQIIHYQIFGKTYLDEQDVVPLIKLMETVSWAGWSPTSETLMQWIILHQIDVLNGFTFYCFQINKYQIFGKTYLDEQANRCRQGEWKQQTLSHIQSPVNLGFKLWQQYRCTVNKTVRNKPKVHSEYKLLVWQIVDFAW